MSNSQHRLAVLRRDEVEEITGLPRSTIYQRQKEGTFPHSIQIGPRSVGWVESEITAWLNDRIEKSRLYVK